MRTVTWYVSFNANGDAKVGKTAPGRGAAYAAAVLKVIVTIPDMPTPTQGEVTVRLPERLPPTFEVMDPYSGESI